MSIYGRFGDKVTILRRGTLEDVKTLDGRGRARRLLPLPPDPPDGTDGMKASGGGLPEPTAQAEDYAMNKLNEAVEQVEAACSRILPTFEKAKPHWPVQRPSDQRFYPKSINWDGGLWVLGVENGEERAYALASFLNDWEPVP